VDQRASPTDHGQWPPFPEHVAPFPTVPLDFRRELLALAHSLRQSESQSARRWPSCSCRAPRINGLLW